LHRHADVWLAIAETVAILLWLLIARPAHIPLVPLVACILAQSLASSIEFEIGPGSAVPTTPVLIVALFLLPPPLVPVMVIAGMVLASFVRRIRDPLRRDRLSITVGSSFYSLGPALVFSIASVTTPEFGDWPIFLAAAVAQIGFDAASSWFLNCYRLRLPLEALRAPLGFTYLVDLLLLPLGYAAVFATSGTVAALLFLLPLLLLWILQKDRRRQVDRAILLATRDPLTGLPNRDLFHRRLDERLSTSDRMAVLLIDLDRFKEVNDTLGHARGDEVLIEVGRRLAPHLCGSDMAARLGGDEFAIFWDDVDEGSTLARSQSLLAQIRRPFAVAGFDVDVDASIGVVLSGDPQLSATDLLRRADVAMYTAKDDHSGIAFYASERDHYRAQRLALAGRLRRGIENGELLLHFQPQVDLATGNVTAVETVVRWQPPGEAIVPPDEFVGLAERTDLIHPLTSFVITRAIEQAATWHRCGRPLRVAVNLSPRNLSRDDLVDFIGRQLKEKGLSPRALEVELTESAVMDNPARAAEVMSQLRAIGVQVAIDDFGTGHSALSYLTSLPADVLKIDRSFIQAMDTDRTAEMVVQAIVDLARRLGLGVVAEGVETQTAVRALQRFGCSTAQGYYYSRPLSADALEKWLDMHDEAEPSEGGPADRPVLKAI
jgi:diguanylate cyclase (GGDEF)-like protein